MTEAVREDAKAVFAVRAELGPEFDQHLADSFADRIEAEIVRRSTAASDAARQRSREAISVLAITLGVGIPLTAIAATFEGLAGLTVAWIGIAACNAFAAFGRRSQGR